MLGSLAFGAALVLAACGGGGRAATPSCSAALSGAISGTFPCTVKATSYRSADHQSYNSQVDVDSEAGVSLHFLVNALSDKKQYGPDDAGARVELVIIRPDQRFACATAGDGVPAAGGPWTADIASVSPSAARDEVTGLAPYTITGSFTLSAVVV